MSHAYPGRRREVSTHVLLWEGREVSPPPMALAHASSLSSSLTHLSPSLSPLLSSPLLAQEEVHLITLPLLALPLSLTTWPLWRSASHLLTHLSSLPPLEGSCIPPICEEKKRESPLFHTIQHLMAATPPSF